MAGITFGKRIYRLDSVASTQELLKEQFCQGAPEGAIAVALEQTLGKGRRGRYWDSQAGKGLWMSVLIRPEGPESLWTWVPLWAGIVARKAIEALLHERKIKDGILLKWPNDLIFRERKLGGILAENVKDPKGRQAIVLGVGMNLLHRTEEFPPHLRNRAISLLEGTGESFSPDTILERFILVAEELLYLLKPVKTSDIRDQWMPAAWGINDRLRVISGDQVIEGLFTDLGPHGELGLKSDGGEKRFLSSAEGIQRSLTL